MSGLPRLTVAAALAVVITSLALFPLLADGTWLLTAALLVATVAAVGYAARRLGSPRWLIPVLELLAVAVIGILRFLGDVAVLGVLPGADARLLVRGLIEEAVDTIQTNPPPSPVTAGLLFLIAMSIALVAVLVDTTAVTYRSPALAGLPLLVLYAVPVAVALDGVSWIYFALAAGSWLALLLADSRERVGGWGRRLGTRTFAGDPMSPTVGAPPEPLGAVGRRIGVGAVVLAVLLPAVIPGLSEAVFGGGGPGGQGGGGGGRTVTTVNPFVSLGADLTRPEDTEVLRYTTDAEEPGYLNLVTLDTFDGEIWLPTSLKTSGRVGGQPLPLVPGLPDQSILPQVQSRFTSTELTESTWLPVPYPLTAVTVTGPSATDWVWDADNRVVWSPNADSSGLTWDTSNYVVKPRAAELRTPQPVEAGFASAYTELPEIPALVEEEARAATVGAETPFEKAVALQDYFQADDFLYDAATPPVEDDPLTVFLTSKRGFCQQFAGTFAVMARALGLPTRVVVGFVPGEQLDDGSWSVSWHDTHAWPEVYFEGAGWTRFEPTPTNGNVGIALPTWTQAEVTSPGNVGPGRGGSPDDAPRGRDGQTFVPPKADEALAGAAAGAAAVDQASPIPWRWLALGVLVALLLAVPWLIRSWQRRRRLTTVRTGEARAAAAAAWAELSASCLDLDLTWPASRTPRMVAAALIEDLDHSPSPAREPAAAALGRMALTTERARYARTADPVDGLDEDVRRALAGLRASVPRGRRVRAVIYPPSLTRRAGARTADVLDWLDTAPRRARAATRRSATSARRQPEKNTKIKEKV